jgi:hypothetical protein
MEQVGKKVLVFTLDYFHLNEQSILNLFHIGPVMQPPYDVIPALVLCSQCKQIVSSHPVSYSSNPCPGSSLIDGMTLHHWVSMEQVRNEVLVLMLDYFHFNKWSFLNPFHIGLAMQFPFHLLKSNILP